MKLSNVTDAERAEAWKAACVARARAKWCWECSDIATKTTGTPNFCDEHAPKYCNDLPGAELFRKALAMDDGLLD